MSSFYFFSILFGKNVMIKENGNLICFRKDINKMDKADNENEKDII